MAVRQIARIRLRLLHLDDAPAVFAYRSDPVVSKYQSFVPETVEAVHALMSGSWTQFAIELTDGELIGDCGYHLSDEQAEVGITLSPGAQGHGYAREALHTLLGYLFAELGVHRVTASVDPRNTASLALMRRAGFRQEGHLVQSLRFKGEWVDDVLFAILRTEFE